MLKILGTVSVAACFVLAGQSAHACGKGAVLLEDAFNSLQQTWGESNEFMALQNGQLVINERDDSYTALADPTFDDIDYCATVKLLKSTKISGSYGGITFWAMDLDDFYTFQITLDGYATAYRYSGEWIELIKDRETKSVRKGIGATNELRVVTKGGSATLYINGTKFGSITGKLPEGGQRVGFTMESPEKGTATFAFDNLKVNEVSDGQ